jgi:MinD superfamily P-loop ATPase
MSGKSKLKQIAVISGKGGTGKTVLTASLAALIKDKVTVDCDVDAADLHLLLHPEVKERHEFMGGKKAVIDPSLCQKCGRCAVHCRFKAIDKDICIDPLKCEGCGLCAHVCPFGAITMKDNVCGEWFISDTNYGPFVHAKLGIGEDNSGKLVARIRMAAKELAEKNNAGAVIIDGPPGTGCPVMASLSGVDRALIVTEPTLSGLHDAERVMQVTRYFNIPAQIVINKWDLNPAMAERIDKHFKAEGIKTAGRIGFNPAIVKAMVKGQSIVEYGDRESVNEIVKISLWMQE